MRKKAPKLEYENGEYKVINNFEFDLSPLTLTENNEAVIKISFDWSVELPQIERPHQNMVEINEILAEKLKQDFLKVLNNEKYIEKIQLVKV